eukprot:984343-Rhodomonas_salina.1
MSAVVLALTLSFFLNYACWLSGNILLSSVLDLWVIQCPVLPYAVRPDLLHIHYDMSGTDLAYAATRRRSTAQASATRS